MTTTYFSEGFVRDLETRVFSPVSSTRNEALISAMHQILTQCALVDDGSGGGGLKRDVVVSIPGPRSHFQGFPGKYKTDGVTETLTTYRFSKSGSGPEFSGLRSFLDHHVPFFSGKGNSGVIALLYSAVLTRGIGIIRGV